MVVNAKCADQVARCFVREFREIERVRGREEGREEERKSVPAMLLSQDQLCRNVALVMQLWPQEERRKERSLYGDYRKVEHVKPQSLHFFVVTSIRIQFEWHEVGTASMGRSRQKVCRPPGGWGGGFRHEHFPSLDYFTVVAETGVILNSTISKQFEEDCSTHL